MVMAAGAILLNLAVCTILLNFLLCRFVRLEFFPPLFVCCAGSIYSAGWDLGFEQNSLAWGEQNQSVPELMMQMNLVDEAETACMRRVKRIGTTFDFGFGRIISALDYLDMDTILNNKKKDQIIIIKKR